MPASSPVQVLSLSAQSVDETTGAAVNAGEWGMVAVAVQGNGTVTSGVVTIEEAVYGMVGTTQVPFYTGTWSTITTVDVSSLSNVQTVIHLAKSAFSHIRTRISTVIGGGGTITTFIIGSPN